MTDPSSRVSPAATTPPGWQLPQHPDYDTYLRAVCGVLDQEIRSDPKVRAEVLRDPRALHKPLYEALTPPGYPEYTGTYRGTPGTSLEHREVGAPSFTGLAGSRPLPRPAVGPVAPNRG